MTSERPLADSVDVSRFDPPPGQCRPASDSQAGTPDGEAADERRDDGKMNDLLISAARRNEWFLLWLAVVVLAASFVFQPSADGHLRLPSTTTELPGICWWKQTTGMDCPGCGLSRCFVSLAHGDVSAAVHYHPFGLVLFAFVIAQIPYRIFKIRSLARGRFPRRQPLLMAIGWFLVAGLFVQWLLKMAGVF